MGGLISSLNKNICQLYKKRQCRILMLGLDGAGKTTILFKLKRGYVTTTIPTIGFNVDTLEYRNVSLTVWDVGGPEAARHIWKDYLPNSAGLIFVVDSSDRDPDRIEKARDGLHKLLVEDELGDVVLLVLANKQDLPNAMSALELTEKLQLNTIKNRNWHIESTCATAGDGIYDGLNWLSRELEAKK